MGTPTIAFLLFTSLLVQQPLPNVEAAGSQCATVYSGHQYQGVSLPIQDGVDSQAYHPYMNYVPSSVSVSPNCFLTLRDNHWQLYSFEGNQAYINWNAYRTLNSFCCECGGCTGESERLENPTCARLFERPRCDGCNGFRLELRSGDSPRDLGQISSSTFSIALRSGCMLTLFEKADFQGWRLNYSQPTNLLGSSWFRKVSSAICECEDDNAIPEWPPVTLPTLPPSKPTPSVTPSTVPPRPPTSFPTLPPRPTVTFPTVSTRRPFPYFTRPTKPPPMTFPTESVPPLPTRPSATLPTVATKHPFYWPNTVPTKPPATTTQSPSTTKQSPTATTTVKPSSTKPPPTTTPPWFGPDSSEEIATATTQLPSTTKPPPTTTPSWFGPDSSEEIITATNTSTPTFNATTNVTTATNTTHKPDTLAPWSSEEVYPESGEEPEEEMTTPESLLPQTTLPSASNESEEDPWNDDFEEASTTEAPFSLSSEEASESKEASYETEANISATLTNATMTSATDEAESTTSTEENNTSEDIWGGFDAEDPPQVNSTVTEESDEDEDAGDIGESKNDDWDLWD